MKSAIAVAITLAGLAFLGSAHAQSSARAWSLTQEGVSVLDPAGLRAVNVALPGWHWAGAPYGAAPVLAIGPQGEAIVTSDVAPVLWRVDPKTLAVSVHPLVLDADNDKDIGFSTLAYSREHDAFVGVSGMHGSVWMIDRALMRARKVKY
jgi:hypothetical protein